MKKAEIRQRDILKHLQEQGSYSYEDIMENYGISVRTMKADMASLNAQGFHIVGVAEKKAYELISDDKLTLEESFYDAPDRKKVRKLIISLIVSSSVDGVAYNREGILYIRDKIGDPDDPLELLQENFDRKDITKSLESTVEEMISDGELIVSAGKLLPAADSQIQLPLSRTDAYRLLSLIQLLAKGETNEAILMGIGDKLSLSLTGERLGNRDYSDIILNSRGRQKATDDTVLRILAKQSYTTNAVRITYKNRKGQIVTRDVAAGLIVYSSDKDKSYLMGEALTDEVDYSIRPNKGRILIDLSTIEAIEKLDIANTVFRSPKYLEIADAMFEISVDDAEYVKVEFDDIPSINSKLLRLVANRKRAVLRKEGDKLIYEDMVSGMNDFAHYIRRFGYGAKVLEPQALKKQMRESCERLLEIYRKDSL